MKNLVEKIIDGGIKPHHQLWEIYFTRKLNSISLIGCVNMLLGIAFF